MGAWGVGLYSSDFAQDLRGAAAAVTRLSVAPDQLLAYLRAAEPDVADDSSDADHTVFWLTVADQFAMRGIDCLEVRTRALAIIAGGADLATMAALGMDERSLAKRAVMLKSLEARIAAPSAPSKPRSVLKAPQPLLLEVGEVSTYPVRAGEPINPYLAAGAAGAWIHDGWGAFVVAERGHVFDFLAWYRPLVVTETLPSAPTLADLERPRMWLLRNPGTLTARHQTRLQLASVGRAPFDAAKLEACFPDRMSPVSCAVSDISLANNLHVRDLGVHEAHRVRHGYPATPRIDALASVLRRD